MPSLFHSCIMSHICPSVVFDSFSTYDSYLNHISFIQGCSISALFEGTWLEDHSLSEICDYDLPSRANEDDTAFQHPYSLIVQWTRQETNTLWTPSTYVSSSTGMVVSSLDMLYLHKYLFKFCSHITFLYIMSLSMLALKRGVFKVWHFQYDIQNVSLDHNPHSSWHTNTEKS